MGVNAYARLMEEGEIVIDAIRGGAGNPGATWTCTSTARDSLIPSNATVVTRWTIEVATHCKPAECR